MISSIKDKLNNINYDVTTGNRNAGVMILLSKISDKNFTVTYFFFHLDYKLFDYNHLFLMHMKDTLCNQPHY